MNQLPHVDANKLHIQQLSNVDDAAYIIDEYSDGSGVRTRFVCGSTRLLSVVKLLQTWEINTPIDYGDPVYGAVSHPTAMLSLTRSP